MDTYHLTWDSKRKYGLSRTGYENMVWVTRFVRIVVGS